MSYFKRAWTAAQERRNPYFQGTSQAKAWEHAHKAELAGGPVREWQYYDRCDFAKIVCARCGKDTAIAYARGPYQPFYCPTCKGLVELEESANCQ